MRDYLELVKALRYCANNSLEDCESCPRTNAHECNSKDMMLEEADAIEELLAEKAKIENSGKLLAAAFERLKEKVPTWISVEDALPDVAIGVLCYCPINKCRYTACFDGERWWHFGGTSPIWFDVTHWMPLPEPPKEEA